MGWCVKVWEGGPEGSGVDRQFLFHAFVSVAGFRRFHK
jgi:hypothetical protein